MTNNGVLITVSIKSLYTIIVETSYLSIYIYSKNIIAT